jgi:DNA-directed RNA polymerase subunit RPC12/RpoP
MSIAVETTQLEYAFPYDDVFDAIVSIAPTLNGFKLNSQDRATGRITISPGARLFSAGESFTILVERVDDNNARVAIESGMKGGLNSVGVHRHAKNFHRVAEAIRSHLHIRRRKHVVDRIIPSSAPLDTGTSNRSNVPLTGETAKQPVNASFDCYKCGRHIVVDQASAGHPVKCPACEAELTIPPARPDSAGRIASLDGHLKKLPGQKASWRQIDSSDGRKRWFGRQRRKP